MLTIASTSRRCIDVTARVAAAWRITSRSSTSSPRSSTSSKQPQHDVAPSTSAPQADTPLPPIMSGLLSPLPPTRVKPLPTGKLRDDLEAFQLGLDADPYAHILASPLRRCAVSGATLPSALMIAFRRGKLEEQSFERAWEGDISRRKRRDTHPAFHGELAGTIEGGAKEGGEQGEASQGETPRDAKPAKEADEARDAKDSKDTKEAQVAEGAKPLRGAKAEKEASEGAKAEKDPAAEAASKESNATPPSKAPPSANKKDMKEKKAAQPKSVLVPHHILNPRWDQQRSGKSVWMVLDAGMIRAGLTKLNLRTAGKSGLAPGGVEKTLELVGHQMRERVWHEAHLLRVRVKAGRLGGGARIVRDGIAASDGGEGFRLTLDEMGEDGIHLKPLLGEKRAEAVWKELQALVETKRTASPTRRSRAKKSRKSKAPSTSSAGTAAEIEPAATPAGPSTSPDIGAGAKILEVGPHPLAVPLLVSIWRVQRWGESAGDGDMDVEGAAEGFDAREVGQEIAASSGDGSTTLAQKESRFPMRAGHAARGQ